MLDRTIIGYKNVDRWQRTTAQVSHMPLMLYALFFRVTLLQVITRRWSWWQSTVHMHSSFFSLLSHSRVPMTHCLPHHGRRLRLSRAGTPPLSAPDSTKFDSRASLQYNRPQHFRFLLRNPRNHFQTLQAPWPKKVVPQEAAKAPRRRRGRRARRMQQHQSKQQRTSRPRQPSLRSGIKVQNQTQRRTCYCWLHKHKRLTRVQ